MPNLCSNLPKQLVALCISLLGVVSSTQAADAADALLLSDTQRQKLQNYFPAEDESTPLIYRGDPLSIRMPVNVEKRVIFPEPIEVNVNGSLSSDQLRLINNDQSLYLTALKPFSTTRIYVTLKQSNKILLMDLETADNATNMTRTVKLANAANPVATGVASGLPAVASAVNMTPSTSGTSNTVTYSRVDDSEPVGSADSYVHALRFAWQQLYAPKRLLDSNNSFGFTRTPMHTEPWVSTLVYGDKVLAHPEVSWMSGNLYVTAVELRNKYPHSTEVNLKRDVCGEWLAATLYPRTSLKPAGDKSGDTTTLLLVSDQPFAQAMEVCHGGA